MTRRLAIISVLTLALAGCTVGPDYRPPETALPDRFLEPSAAGRVSDEWWRVFADPLLDQLIDQALAGSPDLRVAAARIREARAERDIIETRDWPEASAELSGRRQHGSEYVPGGTPPGGLGKGIGSNLWLAGFDAGWEIDIFGGTRRALESADAAVAAAEADQSDARLTLIGEISRDYIELRAAQRRLAVAGQIKLIREDVLHLVTAQFDSGLASALDRRRAEAALAESEAELPAYEIAERDTIFQLATLAGAPPENLTGLLLPPRPQPQAEIEVPIGLPSELLERRPDIRAAERRVAAANALIGAREADLYPHFSLTGAVGLESLQSQNWFTSGSRYFAVGPQLGWRVFDAGKIRSEMLAEGARTDAAAARYRKTVLAALSEVEGALVAHGRSRIQRDAYRRQVEAASQELELARRLYTRGLADFLAVLDAERELRGAEMGQVSADRDCALSLVALYKALGGGW